MPRDAVQRNIRAQEGEPTFGVMTSVMRRGPNIVPPAIAEPLGSDTSQDYDGRGVTKRNVAPFRPTVDDAIVETLSGTSHGVTEMLHIEAPETSTR